jgi:hypothetical protein
MSSKQFRLNQIWKAAADYEAMYITGAPISVFTASALAKLPKALAVFNWSKNIWTLCLQRQAAINALPANDNAELTDDLIDYRSVGAIPYTITDIFNEYMAAPTITNFTPLNGVAGTTVTINGSNFTGTTAVTFNGVNAASFIIVSNTVITAIVPASGFIAGPITVTNATGMIISQQTYVRA